MDATEKAFDSIRESSIVGQTLSAGVITFTVTFSKEIGTLDVGSAATLLLFSSWIILLISNGAGIWTLLAVVTVLEPKEPPDPHNPTIRTLQIALPFVLQLVALGAGVLVLVVYGIITILSTFHTT